MNRTYKSYKTYKMKTKELSELRQDPISGDWVIISTARAKRPESFKLLQHNRYETPIETCPFEDPQAHGNGEPLLMYGKNGSDWSVQVIKNKFPIVSGDECVLAPRQYGPYLFQVPASGYHEVVVLRDHTKTLARLNPAEVELVIRAYQERFQALKKAECADYILIIHNHGREAGASVSHPHSQILAAPFVPADIRRSLAGSQRYQTERGRCVHCDIIAWELKEKKRLIFENDSMVALVPYAPRFSFEIRIFPKEHSAHFEEIDPEDRRDLAEALKVSLAKIYHGLNDVAYNFFIHTAPVSLNQPYDFYHWHIEINPRIATWGGFELGTGGDVIDIDPDEAAKHLRSIKVI